MKGLKRLKRVPIPDQLFGRKKEILGDLKGNTMVDCVYNRLLTNPNRSLSYGMKSLKVITPDFIKDYQLEDLNKSLTLKNVFNINKPGYGKTFETIMWIKIRLQSLLHLKVLILCPKSVVSTWINQLNKYWPEWQSHGDWVITNYEQLYNKKRFDKASSIFWDIIVLDESHRIKSMKSKITNIVFQLNSRFKHCLTGTPIKNRPWDLAAQLKWLDQESITNFTDFQLTFSEIVRDEWGIKPIGLTKDKVMLDNLQKLLDVYCIGGEEHDVTYPPQYVKVKLKMDSPVKKLYDQVVGEWDEELQMKVINTEQLLSQGIKVSNPIESATRRQQLTSNPQLFNDQLKNVKFEWILDWLEGIDEKVIIMSKFAKTIEQLEKVFNANKVQFKKVERTQNTEMRQAAINQWSKGNAQVLIGTYGVLKEGIDGMQENCHYMIFIDREWNSSDNEQAEKRIMRTGQTKQCVFYILQCISTIDIKIERVQSNKAEDILRLLEPVTEEENYE